MDNLIIFCAKYLIFIIGLVVLAVWARQKGKYRYKFVVTVVSAVTIALVLSKLAGLLYYHPRPFVTSGAQPLVSHTVDNGFPSDHTIVAMALAMIIYFYSQRLGIIAFILATLVGIGRVAAHVHSPIDIVGGTALGLLAGCAGYWLVGRLLNKKSKLPVV